MLDLQNWTVETITLNFQVTLYIVDRAAPADEAGDVAIVLERPFELSARGAGVRIVDPLTPSSMTVVPTLLRAGTDQVHVSRLGVLTLKCLDGSTLVAQPSPEYESWSLSTSDGGRLICMPDGGLAVWLSVR